MEPDEEDKGEEEDEPVSDTDGATELSGVDCPATLVVLDDSAGCERGLLRICGNPAIVLGMGIAGIG